MRCLKIHSLRPWWVAPGGRSRSAAQAQAKPAIITRARSALFQAQRGKPLEARDFGFSRRHGKSPPPGWKAGFALAGAMTCTPRMFMVRGAGLEPARCCHRQDLNLVRLPISPPALRNHMRGKRCISHPCVIGQHWILTVKTEPTKKSAHHFRFDDLSGCAPMLRWDAVHETTLHTWPAKPRASARSPTPAHP